MKCNDLQQLKFCDVKIIILYINKRFGDDKKYAAGYCSIDDQIKQY